jgi:anti-sigma factor RsiW
MSCSNPIAWETLVDYWAGDLDAVAEGAVEDHVFGCADCTAASARVAAVTEPLRAALQPVVSRREVEQLRAGGTRIRESDFTPGERRSVQFPADTDLMIHRLSGLDLTGAEKVGFRITSESTGAVLVAVDAVPFDPTEGAVLVACQRHYAELPHDTVMTVSVHGPGGPPRTATYTILHQFL